MEIDGLLPQRTLEVSCPHTYAQVEFYIQQPQDEEGHNTATDMFGTVLRHALRRMFGAAGAPALGHEVLGFRGEDAPGPSATRQAGARATAVVRLPRESFGKFMAACAAQSSYDGIPCTLSVTHASPHLGCLAGAGASSSLAAGCLQQLLAGCQQD